MNWLFLAVVFAFPGLSVCAQSNVRPGEFSRIRSDEDYRHYYSAPKDSLLDRIKFISIGDGPDSYMTLGGEFREKFENYSHENWGRVKTQDHRLLNRIMFHTDVHWGRSRLFAELKNGFASNNNYPSRPYIDEDKLDFNQLFVERELSEEFRLRVGRQELSYGAERFIGPRDGVNVRQGFDGIKSMVSSEAIRWDFFWTMPAPTQPGVLDDHSSVHQQFWGTYSVADIAEKMKLDFYYFGLRDDFAKFQSGAGKELRHTLGARLHDDSSNLDYDFEGASQVGTSGKKSIWAWMLATDNGYRFSQAPLKPRIAVKASMTSGDRDDQDGQLGTFNPLFARRSIVDPSLTIGNINITNLNGYTDFVILPPLKAAVGYSSFWRTSAHDAVYDPGQRVLRSSKGSDARFIGAGIWTSMNWTVTKHFRLTPVYTHISAGQFIEDTRPASDIDYFNLTASLLY